MILTDMMSKEKMYVHPEHIIMAIPLVTPPTSAAAEIPAREEIKDVNGNVLSAAVAAVPAVAEKPAMVFPGCRIILSSIAQGQNMLVCAESPTDVHNAAVAELNNRKGK